VSDNIDQSQIPPLGEGYAHSRKAYGLVSALLIAWELIGVELEASPIENIKLTLKSPQAAPYVLIVLIIYFSFRTTIEWYQNDVRRRRLLASRIDFTAAHAIAAVAIVLYAFQSLSKIQVANTISSSSSQFFIVGFTLAQPVITFLFFPHIIRRWREEKFQALITLLIAFFGLGMFAWALFVAVTRHDFSFLILAGIGFVVALTLAVLVRWIVSWLE
jgi:hypothetical protein